MYIRKKIECYSPVYYLTSFLRFSNYELEDIDTLYREMYEKGSSFSVLKQIDTFYITQPIITGDTILIERATEIGIAEIYDYKIVLPNISKSHNITDIKVGDDFVVDITKGNCSVGHTATRIKPVISLNVDGNVVTPYYESINHYIVFVSK